MGRRSLQPLGSGAVRQGRWMGRAQAPLAARLGDAPLRRGRLVGPVAASAAAGRGQDGQAWSGPGVASGSSPASTSRMLLASRLK